MTPTLRSGDGLVAVRWPRVRRNQLRVVEHPRRPGFWLVKRIGAIAGTGDDLRAELISDNAEFPGVVDSRRLGMVPVASSYLVVRVVPRDR